jgi:hypothetical protein
MVQSLTPFPPRRWIVVIRWTRKTHDWAQESHEERIFVILAVDSNPFVPESRPARTRLGLDQSFPELAALKDLRLQPCDFWTFASSLSCLDAFDFVAHAAQLA